MTTRAKVLSSLFSVGCGPILCGSQMNYGRVLVVIVAAAVTGDVDRLKFRL